VPAIARDSLKKRYHIIEHIFYHAQMEKDEAHFTEAGHPMKILTALLIFCLIDSCQFDF
jgi:hypothetical protein